MEPKRISIIAASVAAFVVVALIALLVYGAQGPGSASRLGGSTETLFQQQWTQHGGMQFLLTVTAGTDSQAMSADVLTIKRRLATLVNPSETQVYVDYLANGLPSNIIVVQVAGHIADEASIASLLDATGQLDVIDTGTDPLVIGADVTGQTCSTSCAPGQYKIVFTGSQLDANQIAAGLDLSSGKPIVTFAFTGKAKTDFATYTAQNVGNYLTITLDNRVIESATIQSEIDGNGQITGIGNITDAQNLAALLKYGALPLPLNVVSSQEIAPTIGQQALEFSIRAAIVGLGMVVLFMLIYYRLPGLIADLALILYALLLFAVIKLLGVTLSLPGIAAVILTIGMAVDANILIFERMKEELRAGRTMASAVDLGFKRAWPSIRDSNFSTLITCLILYWFGNNFGATLIVGFAINLALGVLLSLFTAVVVTRNFLHVLQLAGISQHPALYGLPQSALKLPRYRPSERRAQRAGSLALAGGGSVAVAAGPEVEAEDVEEDDETTAASTGNGSNGGTPTSRRAGATNTVSGGEE